MLSVRAHLFSIPESLSAPGCSSSNHWLCFDGAGVDGHAGYGVDPHRVESIDFVLLLDAARHDELFGGARSEDRGYVDGKALHRAFGVDMRVEEGGAGVFKPGDCFFRSEIDGVSPAFDGDFARFGIDAEDQGFFTEGSHEVFSEFEVDEFVAAGLVAFGRAEQAGAIDDSLCAGFKENTAVFGRSEASPDLTRKTFCDHLDQVAVVALTHRGIEIDQLDDRIFREAFDPVVEVVEGEFQFFALDELNDSAAHEID